MLNITKKDTMFTTQYTDISNKIKEVKHSIVSNLVESREHEERIVEELYRVFMHKAS